MLTPDHVLRSDNLCFVSDDKRNAAKCVLMFAAALDASFKRMVTCQRCGELFGDPREIQWGARKYCDACVKT